MKITNKKGETGALGKISPKKILVIRDYWSSRKKASEKNRDEMIKYLEKKEFLRYLTNLHFRLKMYYFNTGNPINEKYLEEVNSVEYKIKELKQQLGEKKR